MTGGNKRPRSSGMMSELDRKVHRLLRDYMIDEQAVTGAPFTFPSTSALMNYVCEVDRSLKRQKQLQLEKCIERVVPHLRRQQQEQSMASNPASSTGATEAHTSDDDAEPELDGSAKFNGLETVPTMEVRNTNAMNGSLMKLWGAKSAATAASMSTTTSVPATPRALATTTAGDLDGATDTAATTPKNTAGKGYVEANDEPEAAKTAERDARRKKRTKISDRSKYTPPDTRLSDLGGVDACIEEILELIVMPLKHPEIYLHTGVQPPRGVLLHGPPGCGKTLLANAIAGEVGVPFLQISAPSIVSGMSGESEKKLREVFEEARDVAPCIVFIDEIDAITPKRENAQREMERRIVAQMLTCIDDLSWEKTENKPVMLIGATNRPDSLDPALRRAGRFDREIAMTVPDELAREQILRVLCERLRLAGDFDMHELAKRTPGYVGADLTALTTAAGMIAVKRIFHRMQSMPVGEAAEGLATKLAEVLVEAEAIEAIDANSQAMHVDEDAAAQQGASTPASWDARPATERLRTIADFLARHPEPLTPAELEPLAITGPDFFEALKK
ncbi:Ribosome biogenesis ATPase rix7, partial [Coemansia sp. Benny D115]